MIALQNLDRPGQIMQAILMNIQPTGAPTAAHRIMPRPSHRLPELTEHCSCYQMCKEAVCLPDLLPG